MTRPLFAGSYAGHVVRSRMADKGGKNLSIDNDDCHFEIVKIIFIRNVKRTAQKCLFRTEFCIWCMILSFVLVMSDSECERATSYLTSYPRRRSRIIGDRFPKQRVPSRWASLRNVLDFFYP